MEAYKNKDALDKTVKPMILEWLSNVFGYDNYPHSFKDQWITWNVWNNQLSVGFDWRQEEHKRLFDFIHPRFKGVPQTSTLKIVNEDNFYIEVDKIVHIDYPTIQSSVLIYKTKHTDNDGDVFYTYDWEVFLSDGTSIMYHNQNDKMDMIRRNFNYDATIQERAFVNFLELKFKVPSPIIQLTNKDT
jgi:hypothetical protein